MRDLAYWPSKEPLLREKNFLRKRSFLNNLNHIDQIWDYMKNRCGDKLAVSDLRGKNKERFSYNQLADLINMAAKVFFSLGIRRGDVITIISENSPRWLIVDQALMRIGAIDAVRGCNSPTIELEYIIKHSNSVALIVQSKEIWQKISKKKELKKKFKFILNLEDDINEDLINWNEFISYKIIRDLSNYYSEIKRSKSNDIATILYTSGTTGQPKGVPLTHENFLYQIRNLACIADPTPGTAVLSVLPIWHSYERSAEYFFFSCGCSQFYTSPKYLKDDIKKIKPVVMATVPRLWEAIYDGFFLALKKMPSKKQMIIKLLLKNSSIYKKNLRLLRNLGLTKVNLNSKVPILISILLRYILHKISTTFLWPAILKQLCGDKLKFPINGGGALPEHVDLFFEALGINVLVGYGLTETSPVLTCRRTWANVRGSSGQALPFTEIKIVNEAKDKILNFYETGKILVKGPQVMSGYLNNKSATKKVLSADGWFDTGDLGFLIPNGSLIITGRSKDTIVLSSGENIEPNPLETQILSAEFINQIQLIGQDKKKLSALIVPNFEYIETKFFIKGLNSINKNIEIKNFYKSHINNLLKKRLGFRNEEQIMDCYFVNPFTIENGLLTQTLKQKRKEIEKLYSDEIEEIYKKQIIKENIV
ncbi:MAG: long-chain fatty acid--CoA ligase [Prochlorococcus sp. SP3034]|nr:long-chain fatty acid--CoA ligase [Prochlorococcus sp. SP3034]|tara:strand:+ start:11292 stop:13241 length:1950 start_codon:yes stop_codon:yes gene_type:complete